MNLNKQLVGAIKIHGINLISLEEEEKLDRINRLQKIFLNLDYNITLVKSNSVIDFSDNIKFLNRREDVIKLSNYKNKSMMFLELEKYKQQFENLSKDKFFVQEEWFLFYYADNEKELNEEKREIIRIFSSLFKVTQLSQTEMIKIINKILNPLSNELKDKIDYNNDYKNITFKSWFFKKDNVDSSYFYSISQVYGGGKGVPNWFWLYSLSSLNNTIVVHISSIERQKQKELLQKALTNMELKHMEMHGSKTELVDKVSVANEYSILDDIKDDVAKNIEDIKNYVMLILTYGVNKSDLKDNLRDLIAGCKKINITLNNCSFAQKDYFPLLFPNNLTKINDVNLQLPSLSFASSFPFQDTCLIDKKGLYLGNNRDEHPCTLDLFERSKQRINSNTMIMGSSGSGKTTLIKKIISYHLATGGICFVFDPESEYIELTKNWNGLVINATDGSKNKINPLEIMNYDSDEEWTNENSDGYARNKIVISNHLSFLKAFFQELNLPLERISKFKLVEVKIKELYKRFGLYEKSLSKLTGQDFPIMEDLINYLKEDELYLQKDKEYYEFVSVIQETFSNNGILQNLFNGISKLQFGTNNIIDFDVKDLLANVDKSRVSATISLIVSYVVLAINKNAYFNKKDPRKVMLVLDEFHLFINEKDTFMLNFISETAKRIRKRNGALILSTQNPSNLIGNSDLERLTKGIIGNMQYNFLGTFKPEDIQHLIKIYENSGVPLTAPELDWMKEGTVGNFVLSISNNLRQMINVKLTNFERNKVGKGINKLIDEQQEINNNE